jgi:hypothetical protein
MRDIDIVLRLLEDSLKHKGNIRQNLEAARTFAKRVQHAQRGEPIPVNLCLCKTAYKRVLSQKTGWQVLDGGHPIYSRR